MTTPSRVPCSDGLVFLVVRCRKCAGESRVEVIRPVFVTAEDGKVSVEGFCGSDADFCRYCDGKVDAIGYEGESTGDTYVRRMRGEA